MKNNIFRNGKVPIGILDAIIIGGILSLGAVLALQF